MVSENDSSPRPQHNPWNKGRIAHAAADHEEGAAAGITPRHTRKCRSAHSLR